MLPKLLEYIQSSIGFVMLTVVFLSVLTLGGNMPVTWSFLSLIMVLLLLIQFGIAQSSMIPLAVQRLLVPGVLYLTVLSWAWIQITGNVPEGWVHPVWSYVPDTDGVISADPTRGRHAVMRLLCYGGIFLVTVWTCVEPRRASLTLKAIAIFTTAVSIFGFYAFATGENVFLGDRASAGQVQSTFVNRNNYATYAVFGVLANLAAFLHVSGQQSDTLRGRLDGFFSQGWIYAFGILLGIGAVSLTQSRAGGVAGLIGLAAFFLVWRSRQYRAGNWDRVMFAMLLGVLFVISMTSATGLTARLLATSEEDGRFAVYPIILQTIIDRPLLGHGLGAFQDVFRADVPLELSQKDWARAHNTFFELAFGLGLPATIILLGSIGLIVRRIYLGTQARRMNRSHSCFAFACAAAAGFHSFFDFSLQMPAVASLFAVILGLGWGQSFTHDQKRRYANRVKTRLGKQIK